jgi:hypothetical protein
MVAWGCRRGVGWGGQKCVHELGVLLAAVRVRRLRGGRGFSQNAARLARVTSYHFVVMTRLSGRCSLSANETMTSFWPTRRVHELDCFGGSWWKHVKPRRTKITSMHEPDA